MVPFSKVRSVLLAIAFIILVGGIGYRLGERRVTLSVSDNQVIVNQTPPPQSQVDFALFWDVWQRVQRYYIDADTIDLQKMLYGAISGAVASLDDPYTAFYPPKENQEFKEELGGTFEGVGAQLGLKENRIIVIAPLKGMPAEQAGIRAGDWILKVNDEETIGWTVAEAVTKIRGKKGTSVTLEILHESEQKPVEITITRDDIVVNAVTNWVKAPGEVEEVAGSTLPSQIRSTNGRVAYLQLSRFGDRLSEEWGSAVDDIVSAQRGGNLEGMVLDLRNNPGGYLEGSVYVASEFVDSGIIVSQVNSDGTKEEYKVSRRGRLLDIPLIVLINQGSASASEIVAGALKDYKRATIVGETSFGKGSVQTPQDLAGGAGLHVTTGKWLTPNGDSINKTGIKPDVEVVLEPGTEASADGQLAKAIELLLQ